MRDAIDILQATYRRQGRVFSDGPSDPSDGSRHTDERGPQRQQPAGNEISSCHEKAGYRASEQDNSFAAPSHHVGSRNVPQENVDHRHNPLKVIKDEEKLVSTYVSELESNVEQLDNYLNELGEGLDH